jgi:uncharacterized membrane protein
MSLFEHVPHPHISARRMSGPIKVADQHPTDSAAQRFNTRVAITVTRVVGSMWCAYAFALLALVSLPNAIHGGTATLVAWTAQTFIQLVLLSIIMVGQDVQAKASDARAEATYRDAEAILDSLRQIAGHLGAQDEHAAALADQLSGVAVRVVGGAPGTHGPDYVANALGDQSD